MDCSTCSGFPECHKKDIKTILEQSQFEEKDKAINVRCTTTEHALITAKAKSHGMSTSEYVRFVSLNAVVEIKTKEGNK